MAELPKVLYTVEEAAKILLVGRSTLYRLIRERQVPHREMPNGDLRMSREDIDAVLADAARPVAIP